MKNVVEKSLPIIPPQSKLGPYSALGIPASAENIPYNGLYLLVAPHPIISPQQVELNFTGLPGTGSAIYFKLCFWLPKKGFYLAKADEWMEIAPTHQEYYARVNAAKQQLEGQIKQGLASASSAVSDYELIKHDLRRYKEIMNYFAKNDEHSLRAMFIDQIDVHTGNMAMVQMVQRWPTLIADFQKLNSGDVDTDKVHKKLGISKAEAIILVTKNKIFNEWVDLFREAVVDRYTRIRKLVEARKSSIDEYYSWLKPYLARFKAMKLKHERKGMIGKSLRAFADATGQSTFENKIYLWAWKPFRAPEPGKAAEELIEGFVINPYDEYIRQCFILNPKGGLAAFYPWLRDPRKHCVKCDRYFKVVHPNEINTLEYCPACNTHLDDKFYADEIVQRIIKTWDERGGDKKEIYYIFYDIEVTRLGIRLQTGELEDLTFMVKGHILSHNLILIKMLELECKEMEMEKYIEKMLGIIESEDEAEETKAILRSEYPSMIGVKEREKSSLEQFAFEWHDLRKKVQAYMDSIKKKAAQKRPMFFKFGPYESEFKERISKQFIAPSGDPYKEIIGFLKGEMGVM